MKNSRKILYVITFAAVLFLAYLVLGIEEAGEFARWWVMLLLLGLSCLPITVTLFESFHDKGYLFAKPIGIALSGYLLWLLSTMKLMKFTQVNGLICAVLVLAVNGYYFYRIRKNKRKQPLFTTETMKHILNEELIFLLLFLIWCYIKGFKADAYGTEKFMDYGFMTSMMRADYMPPYDLWYQGGVINYYYFGQYLATFLTKISGVSVKLGYNLMLMTIGSLSTLLPYSIITNVAGQMIRKKNSPKRWLSYASGVLAGLLVSFSSNMHYPIFCWIVPMIQEMLGIEVSKYWFPNATRYIGYRPETKDKTIHEFPAYSTVLGDLHAHYINLIFVVTVVGLLFAWYMRQEAKRRQGMSELTKLTRKDYLRETLEPGILMITFFIGMFHMTNFWDFPIYFVVSGAVILFSNAIRFRFRKETLIVTAFQGLFVILGSTVIALPFTLHFDQISTELRLAVNHTPFYQLVILWGLPVILLIGFISSCIYNYQMDKDKIKASAFMPDPEQKAKKKKKKKRNKVADEKSEPGALEKGWHSFQLFILHVDEIDLFILLLGLCAAGLVLMPEIIYVKDIYSGDYKRANTMFKLTYQAFIMFSMCNGYIIMKHLILGTTMRQKRCARAAFVLSMMTICYIGHSVHAWFGDVYKLSARKSLDAAAFMETKMPDDYEAIEWLNENVKGQAVVLEANGDSYSDYERVSVMTGLQTVAGWYVHEWLWRGDTEALNKRNEEIKTIYTSDNIDTIRSLTAKYDLDYIYVGNLEREKFGILADDLIQQMGKIVYSRQSDDKEKGTTYIVKIAK